MTAIDDIDWAVISLKRTPERLAWFLAMNPGHGLPLETLEAVDGRTLPREELVRLGFIEDGLAWNAGGIGAALSHRICWQRAADTGRPIGVFEDDVALRSDFARQIPGLIDAMPADWDIVLLGYNTDSILDVEVAPGCRMRCTFTMKTPTIDDCIRFAQGAGPVAPIRLHQTFGSCAYLVSPKGAARLIDLTFPLTDQATNIPALGFAVSAKSQDALANGFYGVVQAFACVPPLALPHNDKATSTVWVD